MGGGNGYRFPDSVEHDVGGGVDIVSIIYEVKIGCHWQRLL